MTIGKESKVRRRSNRVSLGCYNVRFAQHVYNKNLQLATRMQTNECDLHVSHWPIVFLVKDVAMVRVR